MAKDDYDVIVYRVLVYYYACLKRKILFDKASFNAAVRKDVESEEYMNDVLRMMQDEGLIEGLVFTGTWCGDVILASELSDARITASGIRYIKDNAVMNKVGGILKESADTISKLAALLSLIQEGETMEKKVCPTCGREFDSLSRYCTECGIELISEPNKCSRKTELRKINVLGTEWTVERKSDSEDPLLAVRSGYCDESTKSIVVREKDEAYELGDFSRYQNKCMRHEIIHAFMYESGLAENMEHISIGIEETMIDWIAIQFPKIERAFSEAGCI